MAWRANDRRGAAAVVAAVTLVVTGLSAPPARAFVSVSAGPSFPPTTTVGQRFPFAVGLSNNSSPPESTRFPVLRVAAIDLHPACTVAAADCADGVAEAGVFVADSAGSGQGPPSCQGTWTVTAPTPSSYRLIPPGGEGTLELASGDLCIVNMAAVTIRMPSTDIHADPGTQTVQVVSATFSAPSLPALPREVGIGLSTVVPAEPVLSALATSAPPQAPTPPAVPASTLLTASLAAPPAWGAGAPPTGTVTSRLFPPGDPTCAGPPLVTRAAPVTGFGAAPPAAARITTPGTYRWVAAYSGDANYAASATACGGPGATVTFGKATPALAASAPPRARPGEPVADAVVVAGGVSPTGTLAFTVYRDRACASPPVFTSAVAVAGRGRYTSAPFTPTTAGAYHWVASYGGDAAHEPVSTSCGQDGQTTLVTDAGAPVDFDADGMTDISVFRPSTATWFERRSGGAATAGVWGATGDVPVPGDYDGDGVADRAVFRPATGAWFVNSSGGSPTAGAWGVPGDIPVEGDYDGDGTTDLAVYRPSTGAWFVHRSSGGATSTVWGASGDVPVPADYDGDGTTDVAVFRPSTGTWFVNGSAGVATVIAWGVSGDVPVPADYDGDGRADVVVFRPGTGTWLVNATSAGATSVAWGTAGDAPAPGDYDGDGKTDPAVFRGTTGTWYVTPSGSTPFSVAWGMAGDLALPRPPGVIVTDGPLVDR